MKNTFYENIEKDLADIKFYESHHTLKPFVGENYLNNELGIKILLVGESHYVESPNLEITKEKLLVDWWSQTPPEIYNAGWYNTCGTVKSFMNGAHGASYAMFSEACYIYNEKVLGNKYQNKSDVYNIYNSFAYMNYFQVPSLYAGMSLWNSLLKFNKETKKDCPKSLEIWNKTKEKSNEVFLLSVEILNPDVIIFLSTEARKAFLGQNSNYDVNRIRGTVHPTCAWWNRRMKKYNNRSGKEI